MSLTAFAEVKFWLFVLFSVVAPALIYGVLLAKRAVSHRTVLVLGLTLVVIAGLDLYLMEGLIAISKQTPSLADDALFASELTIALYLLPALFAGVGINLISHVLIRHLSAAERRYEQGRR